MTLLRRVGLAKFLIVTLPTQLSSATRGGWSDLVALLAMLGGGITFAAEAFVTSCTLLRLYVWGIPVVRSIEPQHCKSGNVSKAESSGQGRWKRRAEIRSYAR